MSDWDRLRRNLLAAMAAVACVAGLVFLYFNNPQDLSGFPRCPFYALTGYKCPGCGTLRAIHAALHLRFSDALRLNPILFVAVPAMVAMLFSRKFANNVIVGWTILAVTLIYWVARNI